MPEAWSACITTWSPAVNAPDDPTVMVQVVPLVGIVQVPSADPFLRRLNVHERVLLELEMVTTTFASVPVTFMVLWLAPPAVVAFVVTEVSGQ